MGTRGPSRCIAAVAARTRVRWLRAASLRGSRELLAATTPSFNLHRTWHVRAIHSTGRNDPFSGSRGWSVRVLAIGATGQFAGLVVPALVSRGVQVRALVHDPAKQDRVRDAGADQAVVGDLRDPVSLRAALDGVDGVFLIIPAPDSAALGAGVVAAAQAAGVGR